MTAAAPETHSLEPVAEDLSLYVIGGRVRSSAAAIDEAVAAERVGLRRLWLSERYDLKEAGALLGGMAARTTRLELGTAALFPGSRMPILTAALGARRCTPPTVRGSPSGSARAWRPTSATPTSTSVVPGAARLRTPPSSAGWGGASRSTTTARSAASGGCTWPTHAKGPPPRIYTVMLGGPKACKVAAHPAFDGVYLQLFMTAEAVRQAVNWIREKCDRIGRDFATLRICVPMVSGPELPEERARAYMHARMVTYLGQPGLPEIYTLLNGWDMSRVRPIREHAMFRRDPERIDHHFHREDLMEVVKLVPDEWMYETSLAGSVDECVKKMRAYREAGADEMQKIDGRRLIAGLNPVRVESPWQHVTG